MKLNKKGFTLVELLAVIVVLALLMVVVANTALPALNKSKLSAIKTYAGRVVEKAKEKCMADNCSDNDQYDIKGLMGTSADKSYKGVVKMTDTAGQYNVSGCIKSADGKFFVEINNSDVDEAKTINASTTLPETCIDSVPTS